MYAHALTTRCVVEKGNRNLFPQPILRKFPNQVNMGICAVMSMLHTADCQPRCQRNRGDSEIRIITSGSRVSDQTGTGLDLHKNDQK